jgi:hypothetical protein
MSDFWKKLGGVVGDSAPILGTILGGPLGGAAGGLVKIIASQFGLTGSDAEDPEKLLKAIQADPEAALKLKKFELDHNVELTKLAIESDRMYLADRASAREREVGVTQATGRKNNELYVLAGINVIGFFGALIVLITMGAELNLGEGAWTALSMLLGALVATYKDIIGYFYGSSKGSSDKSDIIAAMRK